MAYKAKENFELAMNAFIEGNEGLSDKVIKNERIINTLEREIADYLVKLSEAQLSDDITKDVTSAFNIINDIERIGDHAKNISDLAREKIYEKVNYDEEDIHDLKVMYNNTLEAIEMAIKAYENRSIKNSGLLKELENAIDVMEKELRSSHIKRLSNGRTTAYGSVIFLDIISNLERIGDHAVNIAGSVEGSV